MREARVIDAAKLCPSLAEFKAHIRLVGSDMDPDLTLKLRAAIMAAEGFVGQILAPSVFTRQCALALSTPLMVPVVSVTSVTVDGEPLDPSLYRVNSDGVLVIDKSVEGEQMVVVYSAGEGDLPDDIKAAILLHAAALFNNPVDSVETMPKASTNLLRRYRRWELPVSAAPITVNQEGA